MNEEYRKESLLEKMISTVSYPLGHLKATFKLEVSRFFLNKIKEEFDKKQGDCIYILSRKSSFKRLTLKESKKIFIEEAIKECFDPYINGTISYKEMKERYSHFFNNIISIYKEILK